jgi:hypothetical protein
MQQFDEAWLLLASVECFSVHLAYGAYLLKPGQADFDLHVSQRTRWGSSLPSTSLYSQSAWKRCSRKFIYEILQSPGSVRAI